MKSIKLKSDRLSDLKTKVRDKIDARIIRKRKEASEKYEKKYFMLKYKIPKKKDLVANILKDIWVGIKDIFAYSKYDYWDWKDERERLKVAFG